MRWNGMFHPMTGKKYDFLCAKFSGFYTGISIGSMDDFLMQISKYLRIIYPGTSYKREFTHCTLLPFSSSNHIAMSSLGIE